MNPRGAISLALLALATPGHSGSKTAAATYLGQPPPGSVPRVFAPGVVSTGNVHSRLTISPDGREMLWNTVDMATLTTRILSVRSVDGRWTDPQPPSFAPTGGAQAPVFSPDGQRLRFMAQVDVRWVPRYVERSGTGWSAPRDDDSRLPSSPSFTSSGSVYYSGAMETKVWNTGIFRARQSAAGLSEAEPLGSSVNVPNAIDYTPFVSADESFLLFSSNRPLIGDKEDMHIHVTFRNAEGAWSPPARLFETEGRFPSISPDGKYLFFCGDDGNVYWVDAAVVETLRPAPPAR